jgi:hypothetical protein
MSTDPANATATRGWPLRFQQAPSSWLSTLIFNAKAITAVGEALPFPYVRGVFGTAIFMLEVVEVCEIIWEEMWLIMILLSESAKESR